MEEQLNKIIWKDTIYFFLKDSSQWVSISLHIHIKSLLNSCPFEVLRLPNCLWSQPLFMLTWSIIYYSFDHNGERDHMIELPSMLIYA